MPQRNRLFGALVRGGRLTKQLTLKEVASSLGTTITEVNDWERHVDRPPHDEVKVRRLADLLDLHGDTLWLVAQMEAAPPYTICVPAAYWSLMSAALRTYVGEMAPDDPRHDWLRVMADVFDGEALSGFLSRLKSGASTGGFR